MNETPTSFEFAEPSSPESLLPDYSFEPWMAPAALALVLALIALGLLIRNLCKKSASTPENQRAAAFKEASSALAAIATDSPRQAAVLSSLILRKYLSIAASDPALYETHEEFITRQDSLGALTEEAHAAADQGFARLAALKYAPQETIDPAAPAAVVAASSELLETLHHGFRA